MRLLSNSFTVSADSSADANSANGTVILFASTGSTMAGCGDAAILKGLEALDVASAATLPPQQY